MSLIIVILILFLLRYHRRAMDRASTQPVLQVERAVRPRDSLPAGARRRSGWCNDNCRHVSRHVVCFPMAEDMYVQSSGGGGTMAQVVAPSSTLQRSLEGECSRLCKLANGTTPRFA